MLAMDWAWKNGVANATERPYVSGTDGKEGKCHRMTSTVSAPSKGSGGQAFGMRGWDKLPENRYEPLLRAVVERGPVGVSVESNNDWFSYSSGIFDSCTR